MKSQGLPVAGSTAGPVLGRAVGFSEPVLHTARLRSSGVEETEVCFLAFFFPFLPFFELTTASRWSDEHPPTSFLPASVSGSCRAPPLPSLRGAVRSPRGAPLPVALTSTLPFPFLAWTGTAPELRIAFWSPLVTVAPGPPPFFLPLAPSLANASPASRTAQHSATADRDNRPPESASIRLTKLSSPPTPVTVCAPASMKG